MSSVVIRNTAFHGIPGASRYLASSSTTVQKPRAKDRTSFPSQNDLPNSKLIVTQSAVTYGGLGLSSRPSRRAHATEKLHPCEPTSSIRTANAPFSTKTSPSPPSPSPAPNGPPSILAKPNQPFPAPYQPSPPKKHTRSPITDWILSSSFRTNALLTMGDWLGYGSPKQVAGRRSKIIYALCSEVALGHDRKFWYDTLSLPPSFQSWFTITNLHIWLATVRLRSLPPSHGRPFVQALIDNFFFDVEDRLRAVLGKKAPERLVTRHMKIFREQWAGLGLACDAALITGDKDMASAMWRNLMGARGARGIAYPTLSTTPVGTSETHSHASNPRVGSSSQPPAKSEDPSTGGVADFEGSAIDRYVMYPELLLVLTSYLRRELVRLEQVSDTTILGGKGRGMRESVFGPDPGTDLAAATIDLREAFKFGSVKDAARKVGVELKGV
ncbi:ubiquinol-cytochrome C chaperone-domain-containing protein [Gautieria morchelliformis]|nr:ubiquinol-cytochrome C chaperone-domain-containing protein [Gautieria morchelliformis]